uniref:Insulin-like domain-containing protein n=1 Tax=Romanomermis culicivorax TaxID=13658 RepID=A0A915K166_ROMCU
MLEKIEGTSHGGRSPYDYDGEILNYYSQKQKRDTIPWINSVDQQVQDERIRVRVKRGRLQGIVEACCHKPCSHNELMTYCKDVCAE